MEEDTDRTQRTDQMRCCCGVDKDVSSCYEAYTNFGQGKDNSTHMHTFWLVYFDTRIVKGDYVGFIDWDPLLFPQF